MLTLKNQRGNIQIDRVFFIVVVAVGLIVVVDVAVVLNNWW